MATFEQVTVGLFLWWSASAALGADDAERAASRYGVAETVERIESSARSRGMKVLSHVDHGHAAEQAGLRIRPTRSLLIGAAGEAGTGGSPARLVVWQGADGVTRVARLRSPRDGPGLLDRQVAAILHAALNVGAGGPPGQPSG